MNSAPPVFDVDAIARVVEDMPPLDFDPAMDQAADRSAALATYLHHYAIDFRLQIPGIRHYWGSYRTAGYRIACHYWLPPTPRGTVFVVHGYFDHCGLYGHLFLALLKQGYAVVAFDLPGHGLSDGERATIASFDRYVAVFAAILDQCRSHLPRPWRTVGQSMGGAIVLQYLMDEQRDPHMFERVALLAPLIQPHHWRINRLIYEVVHRFTRQIARKFVVNSGDRVFLAFLANSDPLQNRHLPVQWVGAMKEWGERFRRLPTSDLPVNIIQGDADTTVDWRYNLKALATKFPAARIELIPGARHHLVNETPALRDQVFAHLFSPA